MYAQILEHGSTDVNHKSKPRTVGAIALYQADPISNSWYFQSLATWRRVHVAYNHWTVLPIPSEVIAAVEERAGREGQPDIHNGCPVFTLSHNVHVPTSDDLSEDHDSDVESESEDEDDDVTTTTTHDDVPFSLDLDMDEDMPSLVLNSNDDLEERSDSIDSEERGDTDAANEATDADDSEERGEAVVGDELRDTQHTSSEERDSTTIMSATRTTSVTMTPTLTGPTMTPPIPEPMMTTKNTAAQKQSTSKMIRSIQITTWMRTEAFDLRERGIMIT
jgi:hypothetical protein